MFSFIQRRLNRKIVVLTLVVLAGVMTLSSLYIVHQREKVLEEMMFAKARTAAMTGAKTMESILEGLLASDLFSPAAIFDTDYRLIETGPYAGHQIPKYHTAYDTHLDAAIQEIEDVYLEDPSIIYAVLVDRNGYLPTHNSRYSKELTGDPAKDLIGNRTKRIFDDPVGIAAARYTGEDGGKVLHQVYHRDTGVTMWDVTAPLFVSGRHWGGFRIGFSMERMDAATAGLRETVFFSGLALLLISGALLHLLINRMTQSLQRMTTVVEDVSHSGQLHKVPERGEDEIGMLAGAFNRMVERLQRTTVSRDELDHILYSMQDALIVVHPDGTIARVNRAARVLLAAEEEELCGKPFQDLFAATDDDLSWFDHFISSRDGQQVEVDFRSVDGRAIPVAFSSAPMLNQKGDVVALICVAQDITERKSSEEKIANAKLFLETVLDSLKEEMMVLDPQSMSIVKANRAFCEAYGVSEAEALGQSCHQVTHSSAEPCGGIEHYCPAMDTLEYGQIECCEHEHAAADGEKQFVEIQVAPVLDDQGKPLYLIHMARDITLRKQAELELRRFARQLEEQNSVLEQKTDEALQAHRQLEVAHADLQESQSRVLQQEKMASIGSLAAGVAHEINNPIGFISSNLSTLVKYSERLTSYLRLQDESLRQSGELPSDLAEQRKKWKIDTICDDLGELLAESREGTDRVQQIVVDLKGFSRVDEAGCKPVDLHECIETTLNIARNEIKYKATVEKEFGDLPPVTCFPQQLNQVFMNLLVNAAHAIEKKGEIRIRTWSADGEVKIVISDNGKGMPDDVKKKIFEPFFTTKPVGKGTGLGLSISYDIIKKHQGRLEVESDVGKGTAFTITLPLKCGEEEVAA